MPKDHYRGGVIGQEVVFESHTRHCGDNCIFSTSSHPKTKSNEDCESNSARFTLSAMCLNMKPLFMNVFVAKLWIIASSKLQHFSPITHAYIRVFSIYIIVHTSLSRSSHMHNNFCEFISINIFCICIVAMKVNISSLDGTHTYAPLRKLRNCSWPGFHHHPRSCLEGKHFIS